MYYQDKRRGETKYVSVSKIDVEIIAVVRNKLQSQNYYLSNIRGKEELYEVAYQMDLKKYVVSLLLFRKETQQFNK